MGGIPPVLTKLIGAKWHWPIIHPKDKLIATQGVQVKVIEEIKPVRIIKTPKGETVLDMGQNMVGWLRIKITGKKGDVIKMQFAEILDKEGNFIPKICVQQKQRIRIS